MANLERCLEAVAPSISCWVIGDTGSTDGTQDYIKSFFAERGIPGELHSFPFENFAHARNEALNRARASKLEYDYLLFTDADMEWTVQDPNFAETLTAAAYLVIQHSGVSYWNNRLLRRDAAAEYKGVTHEYLDVRGGETLSLEGVSFIDHATGSNRVEKYERDARLLRDALAVESDPGLIARYTFYLANTYRDAGQDEAALETYLKRAELGYWYQEVFISLLNVAKLRASLNHDPDDVIAAFVAAAAADRDRAEALHAASRYCRSNDRHERGYQFAVEGLRIAYPKEALFVDDWVYDYGLLDELAINAYWSGRYDECVSACDRLLNEGKLPTGERARVEKNKAFAVEKLRELDAAPPEPGSYDDLLREARERERTEAPEDEVINAHAVAAAADPKRAEALYWAARYCRVRMLNDKGCEFAAKGLAIPRPDDAAGEDWIYDYGLQEEMSIVANYARDPAVKDRGFAACNWLALNRTIPDDPRNIALSNLRFYMMSAVEMMPSFKSHPLGFAPPDGYLPTNPSIIRRGDQFVVVQRAVNYLINMEFLERDMRRYETPDGEPIRTRNFLLQLDDDLAIQSAEEILPPVDLPAPAWELALGFEDMRPFLWRDQLWGVSCARELSPEGWCDQVLARIDPSAAGGARMVDWRVLRPEGPRLHEKNWMPLVCGDDLQFIYLSDPTRLVDDQARTVTESVPLIWASMFRGGSQAVGFDDGWLALVHEARVRDGHREYRHRFAWFDGMYRLRRVSRPFYFHGHGVEFAAGLAGRPDGSGLVITYGVGDNEARIATVEAEDVRRILEDAENLPSGRAANPSSEQDAAASAPPSFVGLLRHAREQERLGESDDTILAAYTRAAAADPSRAEALYDAARYCRIKGLNDKGCAFAAEGLAIERPKNAEAVEDWIYEYGLQEEYSIVANYAPDPATRERGYAACNWLALNRTVPDDSRNLALSNLRFYVRSAAEMMPSFAAREISFAPPEGFRMMNPSIVRSDDQFIVVLRAVNYLINVEVPHDDARRYEAPSGEFRTRNFLLRLDDDFAVRSSAEILPPRDLPDPLWSQAQGFEDLRLFNWRGQLWGVATCRELSAEGWYDQVLTRIDDAAPGAPRFADWRVLHPEGPRQHEKNWMPRVAGDDLQFIYLCDPTRLIDEQARTVVETIPPICAGMFRGGSQAIEFDGGWLAIIHEARILTDGQRQYRHRFVWFDEASRLRRLSRPFYFNSRGIEFGAGLAARPDGSLVITYGIGDKEAWIATVEAEDVRRILEDAEKLPSGRLEAFVGPTSVLPTPMVFIHSSPRTSSTWFWSKFRDSPSTLCYYEPFNEHLSGITRAEASVHGPGSWDSGHPPTGPYYQEYTALIDGPGGVRSFDPAMPFQWFVPVGGLQGDLRPAEHAYLSMLIERAQDSGKIPVFGCARSVGRLGAVKRAFGGCHIFLRRNLWRQWLSLLSFKRRGDNTFVNHALDALTIRDDEYFSYLWEVYGAKARSRTGQRSPNKTPRRYATAPDGAEAEALLESLSESDSFAAFVCSQIYLDLHAELFADLVVDVSRLSRDARYRAEIENAVRGGAGVSIDLSDASERALPPISVDVDAIDWEEIRKHLRVAVRMLSDVGDAERLADSANALLDAAQAEAQRKVNPPSAAPGAEQRTVQTSVAPRPGAKISGFVISYNRADLIETCLRSMRFVDELIVVDKSSTDHTGEIAQRYADRVVIVPWTPTADDTREYALSLCSHDLIVYLDDDECLSPGAIAFIMEEAVAPRAEVYSIPRHDYFLGRFDPRTRDWPDLKERFFRRGAVEFPAVIHGCISIKSANRHVVPPDSEVFIHHLHCASVSDWIEKTDRYTSQPLRESWFVASTGLSTELVRQQTDYWFQGHEADADEHLAAYALLHVAYDIVDRVKRWEQDAGIDGERAFVSLCAALQDDYDELGEMCAARSGPLTIPERSSQPSPAKVALERWLKGPQLNVRLSPFSSASDMFQTLAPFLSAADSPIDRREGSRALDSTMAAALSDRRAAALPQINCFYEVMSEEASHSSLVAATQSMRAAGHAVRVWSYSPAKLEFLAQHGVELRDATDVVPRAVFDRVLGHSEIRYFSDVFRYAVLYEHGGLWMDTDVVMLRPFPFGGDFFFNLQWRDGGKGHFVCGNVIYAQPHSPHMRALYEQALDRCFSAEGWEFGGVGPKLMSDYIASAEGAPLRRWVFSPMLFNTIDWTEIDRFEWPLADLADYLNDDRVVGVHLWNAKTHSAPRDDDRSLIAMLSDPSARMRSFASLADGFNTDKNRHTGNRHCYARVYENLLGEKRFAMRRLMEIGLCRGLAEKNQPETPSVALWQAYFPFCHVVGVDLTDFSHLNNAGFTSFVCDQSKSEDLRATASRLEPGSFDVIIDDGSHASADQQLTLTQFWPLLADGGWYFIEDLDWQPPGEDPAKIALTKDLLGDIQRARAPALDPMLVNDLAGQMEDILFFDSHYELARAALKGGLVAIRKRRPALA